MENEVQIIVTGDNFECYEKIFISLLAYLVLARARARLYKITSGSLVSPNGSSIKKHPRGSGHSCVEDDLEAIARATCMSGGTWTCDDDF